MLSSSFLACLITSQDSQSKCKHLQVLHYPLVKWSLIMIVSCHMNLGWESGYFSHFCLFLDLIIIVEEHKWLHAGPCFHCQVVGEVVIHLAASLILLWGGFPCQEAPAWPPAHQPYLAAAYWRPTAHALALRVGGRAGWQALAQIHFGKSCCPHTSLSEVLTSVQNIKGLRILSLPLVTCRPVQKCWLQYDLKL